VLTSTLNPLRRTEDAYARHANFRVIRRTFRITAYHLDGARLGDGTASVIVGLDAAGRMLEKRGYTR
jgi:hypothetical protein